MLSTSPLIEIAIAWGVVTAVLVVLLIWRSLISMKEEDQLFITGQGSAIAAEQMEIQAKLKRLRPVTKVFTLLSIGLLVLLAGAWLYFALTRFARP